MRRCWSGGGTTREMNSQIDPRIIEEDSGPIRDCAQSKMSWQASWKNYKREYVMIRQHGKAEIDFESSRRIDQQTGKCYPTIPRPS